MNKERASDIIATVFGFKKVQTRERRLLVVAIHVVLWGLFLTLPLFIYRVRIVDNLFLYREMINKTFLIGLFYFNYYYLLPRFFQRRQLVPYFSSILAALVLLCVQEFVLEHYMLKTVEKRYARYGRGRAGFFIHDSIDRPYKLPAFTGAEVRTGAAAGVVAGGNVVTLAMPAGTRPFVPSVVPHIPFFIILKDAVSSFIVILLISGFIKLANSLLISEKQKKILENERLHAELNFLKLQINPHFLFNTLNSIYSQAHLKSEQTEYSILKFSQIMRYVLYDSTGDKIALSKDLEYISNYIDLQKLRVSKNTQISYGVTGNPGGMSIAPLLLITFIENAFKHGLTYATPSHISVTIELSENLLKLQVANAIAKTRIPSEGGVGLINARRRLEVLYPGRHTLDVQEKDGFYIVNLKIELDHEAELSHYR